MNTRRFLFLLFVIVMLLLSVAIAIGSELKEEPQVAIAPGSAARGARLFQEKECLRCHSFQGRGGKTAPDLSQRSERGSTPALLASVMWNHSPAMWAALGPKASRPVLNSTDTADLFAYFYSLLYFSTPGNVAHGKVVFEEKNCAGCHTTRRSANPGPPLSQWAKVNDPITWAERMWNHSGKMYIAMGRSGLSWPEMSPQNLVDLLIYIRSLPETRSQSATFQAGEPDLGRNVFERKCENCHTFGIKQTGKIDLLARPAPWNLTDYIAMMWNHPAMLRRPTPDFHLEPDDMKNLIAYLFAQRYFLEKGDVNRGRTVYNEKNCVRCHGGSGKDLGGPDLAQQVEAFSPVTMAAAVWRHGPAMMEAMKKERIAWPEFHGSEMTNLIAFLNSRLLPKLAAPPKP